MKLDSENFELLLRALKLKRYEAPPPGYFNNFSGKVIARLQAGEQGQKENSWLRRFWMLLEAKPMVAGAFGAAVCTLLMAGVFVSEEAGTSPVAMTPVAIESSPSLGGSAPLVAFNQTDTHPQIVSSTNPVAPSISSLFDQFQLNAQPASFPLSSGN
jgi:hypothetical protein